MDESCRLPAVTLRRDHSLYDDGPVLRPQRQPRSFWPLIPGTLTR